MILGDMRDWKSSTRYNPSKYMLVTLKIRKNLENLMKLWKNPKHEW